MKQLTRLAVISSTVVGCVAATGCANMSQQEKATAIGAGVGAVAGSVLTDGSALGTVGGAVAGGVVGNQVGKKK